MIKIQPSTKATCATDTSVLSAEVEANQVLVDFVKALSKQKSSTPAQIALAWQFAKGVTAPIIGATKAKYFDDAVGTLNLRLTEDDISCLEELYVPHKIVGAI